MGRKMMGESGRVRVVFSYPTGIHRWNTDFTLRGREGLAIVSVWILQPTRMPPAPCPLPRVIRNRGDAVCSVANTEPGI